MINPYDIIQHASLAETAYLMAAHQELRDEGIDYSDTQREPSIMTIPVPTAPTVPTLRSV